MHKISINAESIDDQIVLMMKFTEYNTVLNTLKRKKKKKWLSRKIFGML